MNPWYLLIVPVGIAIIIAIRVRVRQNHHGNGSPGTLWHQLNAEVHIVSLLVSKNCPDNAKAHNAVIQAAMCLVVPSPGYAFVSASSASVLHARYRRGFEFLNEARKLAGAGGTK